MDRRSFLRSLPLAPVALAAIAIGQPFEAKTSKVMLQFDSDAFGSMLTTYSAEIGEIVAGQMQRRSFKARL